MSSRTYPAIGLHTVRITKEDACGVPAWGDSVFAVSDGFVSVQVTANFTDIAEKSITSGRGRKCVRRPADSELDDLTLTSVFCKVDPELYAAITGYPIVVDAQTGDVIGFDVDTDVRPSDTRYGMEGWSEAWDVLECDDASEVPWGYWLWPSLGGGRIGDYTLEDAAVSFSITDSHTYGGAGWGIGPYLVTRDAAGAPSPLIDPMTKSKHQRQFVTTVAPPEVTDGFVPLDDPDTAAATTATAGVPGTWNGVRPFDLTELQASAITGSGGVTAWTIGQYVILGDGSHAYWAGSGAPEPWLLGEAP